MPQACARSNERLLCRGYPLGKCTGNALAALCSCNQWRPGAWLNRKQAHANCHQDANPTDDEESNAPAV